MTQSSQTSPMLHTTALGLFGYVLRALFWFFLMSGIYIGIVTYLVQRQSQHDHTQTADAAIVLGAAVWVGNPSPVLKARLDHAGPIVEDQRLHIGVRLRGEGRGEGCGLAARGTGARSRRQQEGFQIILAMLWDI